MRLIKTIIRWALSFFSLEVRRVQRRSFASGAGVAPKRSTEEILKELDDPFKSALLSLYNGELQKGADGQLHETDREVCISPEEGMWLYELCLSLKPAATLEIGMAYGYSTLYFLAAIAKNRLGCHTAIDPFQQSKWHGIGILNATAYGPRLDAGNTFRFIEDRSDGVATDLVRSGDKYDLIFVDGFHRFDDVLVDFYLYAQVCNIGGCIIVDDMWMRSIQTAVDFIRRNRKDFREIPSKVRNCCIFEKIGDDKRVWHDFVEFNVARAHVVR